MLTRRSNSRQIPDVEKYTANKKYNDSLYGLLQHISKWHEGIRYVRKSDVNFTKIGKKMNLTRQTVAKKFRELKEIGLVEEMGQVYKLNLIDKEDAMLVPDDVLQCLVDTLSQYTISIYVYLLNRFIANQEQPFIITMTQVKRFIGLGVETTNNNHVVRNALIVLSKLGLIEYKQSQVGIDKVETKVLKVRNKWL